MKSKFVIMLVALLLLMPHYTVRCSKYPCSYADTVNITDGLRLKDGSYSYEGLIIPANLTAEYKVKVIDGIEYGTGRHMRGCVCLLKSCMTFCCPHGMYFDSKKQNCTQRASHLANSLYIPSNDDRMPKYNKNHNDNVKYGHIEVTRSNGSVQIVSIPEAYVIRYDLGCKHKLVDRSDAEFGKWDLFANGTLSRDGKLWTTDEYCFTPLEHKKVWSLTPLTCVRQQRGFRVWIYVICVIMAVIINGSMAAFLVSIYRVRNNGFGESIVFYLLSLVIGYTALAYLSLKNPMNLAAATCRSLGFVAYYFIMLSFLLLNFVSLEFWRKFLMKQWTGWKRKLIYGIAMLFAFALRCGIKYAQDSEMPKHLKPGIGDSVCWFDVRLMGIFYFYYLPILLSLAFSVFCCSRAYVAIWNLPNDKEEPPTANMLDMRLAKSQFYAFIAYLIGLISITLREIVVWVTARVREHFFIIDFWTGIGVLALAITGCVCFLWKNKLVKSWWRKNVLHKPDDFVGVSPPTYRNRDHERDRTATASYEMEPISLK